MNQNLLRLTISLLIFSIPITISNQNDSQVQSNSDQLQSNGSESTYFKYIFSSMWQLIALPLIIISIILIWYNERREAINVFRLKEAMKLCTTINCNQQSPETDLKLVHLNGFTHTNDSLIDEEFGVCELQSVKLQRKVEMYQWIKPSENSQCCKSLKFEQDWREGFVDDEKFDQAHKNDKTQMIIMSQTQINQNVSVGVYQLSAFQKERINEPLTKIELDDDNLKQCSYSFGNQGFHYFYIQQSDATDYIIFAQLRNMITVGDLRVSFTKIPCSEITIVAQQVQNTLREWNHHDKFDQTIENNSQLRCSFTNFLGWICCCSCWLGKYFNQPAKEIDWIFQNSDLKEKTKIFEYMQSQSHSDTVKYRIFGFLLMTQGIFVLLMPYFQNSSNSKSDFYVLEFLSGLLALPFFLLVLACAWIFYNLKCGIIMGVISVLLIIIFCLTL